MSSRFARACPPLFHYSASSVVAAAHPPLPSPSISCRWRGTIESGAPPPRSSPPSLSPQSHNIILRSYLFLLLSFSHPHPPYYSLFRSPFLKQMMMMMMMMTIMMMGRSTYQVIAISAVANTRARAQAAAAFVVIVVDHQLLSSRCRRRHFRRCRGHCRGHRR